MQEIKISIIIPVYNGEKYIKRCIKSVLNQTLKEIEIIVINDGSVDKTYEILKSFKDSRLIVINQKNFGVSFSRNEGLKNAKGKYISFIDSDDWVELNYFEEAYEKAIKSDLDILVTDYYFDIENSNKSEYTKDLDIDEYKIISNKDYLEYLFLNNLKGFNWNKLIKRSLFVTNDIFYNEKVKFMEDLLIIINLLKFCKKIGKLNKAFYHYIQHEKNITKKIKFEYLDSVETVFSEIKKQDYVNFEIKKSIEKKESEMIWWAYFNLSEKNIDEKYFFEKYFEKIKKQKIKRYNIFIKIIKLFPFIATIKTIRLLYIIKKR